MPTPLLTNGYLHRNDGFFSVNRYARLSALGANAALGGIINTNVVSDLISSQLKETPYSTSPLTQRWTYPWAPLNDFRTRKFIQIANDDTWTRLGQKKPAGTALLTRHPSTKLGIITALSGVGGGIYSIAGLYGQGKLGYGWGDHGNIDSIRTDYTVQSQVATTWENGTWVRTKNILSKFTPFRGDKINVIDYAKSGSLATIHRWITPKNPDRKITVLGKDISLSDYSLTNDFIKFYFTGPKLSPGSKETDDVIVFRATLGEISDTFQPNWTPVQLVGRADPNYHYSGYSRDISFNFTIYATDRDEMKPIYRKLNALAGYTAPDYASNTIAFKAPWMRITIGDLFNQVPVVISSLSYTLGGSESPWEINFEQDPDMMQVPFRIDVQISLHVIGDSLPQKGGSFYSLAKQYDEFGPKPGNDNWLSDSADQATYKTQRDAKNAAEEAAKNAALALAANKQLIDALSTIT